MTITLVQTRIGTPKPIGLRPKTDAVWYSSIDRQPVSGDVIDVTWEGLIGDKPTQTNPKPDGTGQIHGGPDKAIYVIPDSHITAWRAELGDEVMGNHSLGENWRVTGATESTVRIGDVWKVGDLLFAVTKPRTPCATLECYFGVPMIKRMRANGRCGWYMQPLGQGSIPTRGSVSVVSFDPYALTVAQRFAAKMNLKA